MRLPKEPENDRDAALAGRVASLEYDFDRVGWVASALITGLISGTGAGVLYTLVIFWAAAIFGITAVPTH